jgi:hypothetical protein
MSKAKLLVSGGKYAGTKMKDVLKKIRHKKSAAKSKKSAEKLGLGTKSLSRYNIRARDQNEKVLPSKGMTQKGSSFKVHRVRGPAANSSRGMGRGRQMGSEGTMESWRSDMERISVFPSIQEIQRSIFKKKRKVLGGMLKLKRGGDNMPARNKKNFRPTEKGAGMTEAGVKAYRRANPGSKLKTAVTGKVKAGSKAAKRRKSYCARSAGQMKKFPKAAADPNSRLRQARRRWKC